ncbi:MAG: flap endonuclease-1 [Candidatus Woesearchaeota archaeon]
MGVAFTDYKLGQNITLDYLNGKIVAIDTFNFLYQFLASIRSYDGTPLQNSKGEITSHLVGLLSRTAKMMEAGIKPVFVFDGESHPFKQQERKRRKELKDSALIAYEKAKEIEDYEAMKKFASRSMSLSTKMIEDAKTLVTLLGLPVIQAPCEGEAQASYMCKKGDVYAVASQDYDCLIFGAPRIVRNLAQKKKIKNTFSQQNMLPQLITLSDTLNTLQLDAQQLLILSILIGTDFNYGGVKGIGPQKALKLLHTHKKDFETLFAQVPWDCPYTWQQLVEAFTHMPVTDEYHLEFKAIDTKALTSFLQQQDFEHIDKTIEQLTKKKKNQTSIIRFK